MDHFLFDINHIRYQLIASNEGKPYNWIFLPGGPGADSCYFQSLINFLNLPGNTWFIDFPGSGRNIHPGYNFDRWFDIFLPALKKFENVILVGHSFSGMFPLLFPELENILKGYVILHSAPSLWLEEAAIYSKRFNLPDFSSEMQDFTLNPNEKTFRVALDACMPYYFPPHTLEEGRHFVSQIPFQYLPTVWWQRKAVEINFSAKWVPEQVPTLIVGGTYDCMCPFTLFQRDKRFSRPNITMFNIENGGHFGWLESPNEYKRLFSDFQAKVLSLTVSC